MGRDENGDGDRRRRRDNDDSDRRRDEREHRSSRRRSPGGDDDRDRRRRRSRERRRSKSPDSASRSGRDHHSSRQRDNSSRQRERSRDRDRRSRRTEHDGDDSGKHSSRRRRDADRDRDKPKEKSRGSPVRRGGPLPSQEASFAVTQGEEPAKPKEKANFGNTGLLAAASNAVTQADGSTVALKYHEPAEARRPPPRDQWRLYVFKGADVVDTVDLGARSCWLIGREATVVDLEAAHPSVSGQHAVIQFRYSERRDEFGDRTGRVRPYLIDLESAHGTVLNGGRIQDSRYLELRDKDVVQLGQSTREYVVMLAPRE
ncbi:Forkhead-associated (FHA) domain protein [Cordyceps fumosorosea ARSEF 2679]|uniref:Forkhead-associated (FHA) domain protein n=1 Tax=Cordyceps fumosorosea (strain ARSEF 2679) TaxID=1081104 RepID=A0A168CP56_CORFA|nr:Forkhead-associated (FHA) domain protein [Cordyceps fumosorosea ARSEF 2679]OAA71617.1 Forkhead-associated (FHA) domain protein [Cordyceps fumosorosea ARSEF 2679]